MNDSLAFGKIVMTDASCRLGGHSYAGIPTLVWPEGIDVPVSDWFRKIVVKDGIALSSASQYAEILRVFMRFCRKLRRDWTSVDDNLLVNWREQMIRAKKLGPARVNTCLKTIFAFYRWAEESRYLSYRVGIYDRTALPPELSEMTFAISARQVFRKSQRGRVFGSWTTPLTVSEPSTSEGKRNTPNEDQIRKLHEFAVERENGARDSLLLSWFEETGGRRSEVLRVCKSQLPDATEVAALIEEDRPCVVQVLRKGRRMGQLSPMPDLLLRTLDYLENERREVVDRCRKKFVGYSEPEEVFISSKTGMPLHPDSVTSLGAKLFQKAGISNANVHRLRARFAVRTVEGLIDAMGDVGISLGADSSWKETILQKASERMGQSSPESLRPYLNYVLNRRLQASDAHSTMNRASRVRELERREIILLKRLEREQQIYRASVLIRSGKAEEALDMLEKAKKELEEI
ncbi:MAG: hypothetical protein IPH99_04535 [Xanthomonadales bacterium]|nr:hypothetical protein [Xanthomonadales bacterium]